MLLTLNVILQEHYNEYRIMFGTPDGYKKISKLPGELIESLEINYKYFLFEEVRKIIEEIGVTEARKIIREIERKERTAFLWKLGRFLGSGIALAFIVAFFLNTVVDPLLRLIVN